MRLIHVGVQECLLVVNEEKRIQIQTQRNSVWNILLFGVQLLGKLLTHWVCQIEQSRSRHSSDFSPGVSVRWGQMDGRRWSGSWSRPSRLSVSPSASSLAPAQPSRTSCQRANREHPPPRDPGARLWHGCLHLTFTYTRKSHWENTLSALAPAKKPSCLWAKVVLHLAANP